MDLGLKGKTVIITGGTKGIGSGIAEAFAREGANLILDFRSDEENSFKFVEELKSKYEVEVFGIKADVSVKENVPKIFDFAEEKLGKLDILINNAGPTSNKTEKMIWELTYEEWQYGLDNHVTQYFMMSSEFARRMIAKERKGAIVNILSKASLTTTHKGITVYVTNKTAEMGLMKQMAVDLVDKGIIVNGVMPGSVKNQTYATRSKEFIEARIKRMPMGRYNEPIEIGRLVVFLASDINKVSLGAPVDATAGMMLGF